MKKIVRIAPLLIGLVLLFPKLQAQSYEYVYRNDSDSSMNCYVKAIPDGPIKGLIIRDYSRLPDMRKKSPYRYLELAMQNKYMVLFTVTSNFFPEMFYDDTGPALLDEMVQEVLKKHPIPRQNIFIGGISSSGTRAMRFTQYCEQGKSKYGTKIAGVFSVDSPLDLERFYYSVERNSHLFKKGMKEEVILMKRVFPQKFKGSPAEYPEDYKKASVFSQSDSNGGNAIYFKNVPVLLIHEPDIDWWIKERNASYYDINSYDMAAFYNLLRFWKNDKAKMVTTSQKGFDRNGNRKCHSWTIVDEPMLMRWILDQSS